MGIELNIDICICFAKDFAPGSAMLCGANEGEKNNNVRSNNNGGRLWHLPRLKKKRIRSLSFIIP